MRVRAGRDASRPLRLAARRRREGVPRRALRDLRRLRPGQDPHAAGVGAPGVPRDRRGRPRGGAPRRGRADRRRGREVRHPRRAGARDARRSVRNRRDQLRDAGPLRHDGLRGRRPGRVEHPQELHGQDQAQAHRGVPRGPLPAVLHGHALAERPHGAAEPVGVPGRHAQQRGAVGVVRQRPERGGPLPPQGPCRRELLGVGGHMGHGSLPPERPGLPRRRVRAAAADRARRRRGDRPARRRGGAHALPRAVAVRHVLPPREAQEPGGTLRGRGRRRAKLRRPRPRAGRRVVLPQRRVLPPRAAHPRRGGGAGRRLARGEGARRARVPGGRVPRPGLQAVHLRLRAELPAVQPRGLLRAGLQLRELLPGRAPRLPLRAARPRRGRARRRARRAAHPRRHRAQGGHARWRRRGSRS